MKNALAIILCLTLVQFKLLAQFGGTERYGGYQEPDYTAARGLAEAMSAYQALQIQQEQEEAQDEALQEQQQADEVARQQQVSDKLEGLRQSAVQKTQDATLAEGAVSNLIESTFQNKRLIPKDPWRQIFGTTNYVKSPDSGFIKFYGVILQTTEKGVLVNGNYADTETNFFVENFPWNPYGYSVDDNLDNTTNFYVALPSGTFTYIAIDGSIRCVPKLNYGAPCSRPQNADTIEVAAKKLTPDEELAISSAKDEAKNKTTEAVAATTAMQAFIQELEDEEKAKIQARNVPQNMALKYDQEQAAKSDPYGLLRMGERCRDGDGVPRDLAKARDYLTRAANAGSPTAADELKKLSESSTVTDNATPK